MTNSWSCSWFFATIAYCVTTACVTWGFGRVLEHIERKLGVRDKRY